MWRKIHEHWNSSVGIQQNIVMLYPYNIMFTEIKFYFRANTEVTNNNAAEENTPQWEEKKEGKENSQQGKANWETKVFG